MALFDEGNRAPALHATRIVYDTDAPPRVAPVRVCVGCSASAPETDTAHTLISNKHGWRLHCREDERGLKLTEWRCPACWQTYRATLKPRTGK